MPEKLTNGTVAKVLIAFLSVGVLGLLGWILLTVHRTELTMSELRGQLSTLVTSLAELQTRLSLVESEQRNRALPMAEFKVQLNNIDRRLDKIEAKLP